MRSPEDPSLWLSRLLGRGEKPAMGHKKIQTGFAPGVFWRYAREKSFYRFWTQCFLNTQGGVCA